MNGNRLLCFFKTGAMFDVLNARLGEVENIEEGKTESYSHVIAYLPVSEYIRLKDALESDGSQANKILLNVIKKKGLKQDVLTFADYADRI